MTVGGRLRVPFTCPADSTSGHVVSETSVTRLLTAVNTTQHIDEQLRCQLRLTSRGLWLTRA